jgi:hypothetical protein
MTQVAELDPELPRQIIFTLVRELRANIVPLTSKSLAPTHFVVYLNPDDHLKLAGVGAIIIDEASREMNAEIARLSQWSGRGWRVLHRLLKPWAAAPPLPIDPSALQRQIEILPDPDAALAPGHFTVRTQLPTAPTLDFAGTATVAVTSVSPTAEAAPRAVPNVTARAAFARLTFQDEDGPRTFDIAEDKTLIGRGGQGVWVDVRVRGPVEISQEHVRIRRDAQTGEFFIKDLSRNGTTVNGQRLPQGVVYSGDNKRESEPQEHEVALPATAEIGLAGALTLTFTRLPR